MAAACGTADPEADGTPASDPTVNALEASGRVEFFVRVVGATGQIFSGESTNARFRDSMGHSFGTPGVSMGPGTMR